MFVEQESGRLQYVPTPDNGPVQTRLAAGAYRTNFDSFGQLFFTPVDVTRETLVDLDTEQAQHVRREIADFFDVRITERLISAGLKHRRAILLYGAAGTGKTSLVRGMFPLFISNEAVILIEPDISSVISRIIPAIRLTDSHRVVIIVLDEFHAVVSNGSVRLLQLLDGLQSPEHMMLIGTTNYINRVPKTLCQRPSRFSLVLEIPALPRSARIAFARGKYPMLDTVEQLVDITDRLALDYLEEACKLSLMGYSIQEIQQRFGAIDVTVAREKARQEEEEDEDYE